MYMTLSKLLTVFIDPVGFALVVLAAAAVLAFLLRRKWVWVSPALLLCGFLVLAVFATPLTSRLFVRSLEKKHAPPAILDSASAVVILGGGTVGKQAPRTHVELNHAGNRLLHGARAFRESGSRKLVLAGGVVSAVTDDDVPEAEAMFALLNELFGVDTSEVILETRSRNTRENAINTRLLLESRGLGNNIILVTSAFHMPRAAAVFEKAGFVVTPAPAGFMQPADLAMKPAAWLPNSQSLFESSVAIREYFGILTYKIAGWL